MNRVTASAFALFLAVGLTACDSGGGSDSAPVNTAPAVDAGQAKDAREGSLTTLDGNVVDREQDGTYLWTQISGPTVTISDPTIERPTFIAPLVDEDPINLVFRLSADDGVNPVDSEDVRIRVIQSLRPGLSTIGMPDDVATRRAAALAARSADRPMVAGREVRRYDGVNNNLTNTNWGATFTRLSRVAAADYGDGTDSLAGATRPAPREVSNAFARQAEDELIPNGFEGSDYVWVWGQFVFNDISLTNGAGAPEDIIVPQGDEDLDETGDDTVVIGFNRAAFDPDTGTSIPREQENETTAWLDGSTVYGMDAARNMALREAGTPFLLLEENTDLLPTNADELSNANGYILDPASLFVAGDYRANETLAVAALHTIFAREHNRIAQEILDAEPNTAVDEIYERARRQIIAKIQIITFEEWLPVLLGPNAIADWSSYDATQDPTILQVSSVAAFRALSSAIGENLLQQSPGQTPAQATPRPLSTTFFNAPGLFTSSSSIDPTLRGLAGQLHQAIDPKITFTVRNALYAPRGLGGLDYAAITVQRGRDHGVASYNDVRAALGLARVTQFSEITSDSDLADALFDAYGSVNDIDLWVGGLAEDPAATGQVGETFREILIRQLTAVRDGDRFWWENDLTDDEKTAVAGTTLAGVLQANTAITAEEIQANVFVIEATDDGDAS